MAYIKTPVYTWKTASAALRDRILEKHRDINTDYEWYDCVYENWKEKLEALGYMQPDINFSGFWSQGDGASFTCEYLNSPEIKERFLTPEEKEILKDCEIYGKVERISHHYSHENTVQANISDVDYSQIIYNLQDLDDDQYNTIVKKIDKILVDLEKMITDEVRDLSRKIYRELEKEYEYQTSDESVIETISINEYIFDATGNIVGTESDIDGE